MSVCVTSGKETIRHHSIRMSKEKREEKPRLFIKEIHLFLLEMHRRLMTEKNVFPHPPALSIRPLVRPSVLPSKPTIQQRRGGGGVKGLLNI